MEQEFNDQKHGTSVIVCVYQLCACECVSHRQLNKFTHENQSEQLQSHRNYTDEGTINAFMPVIFIYNYEMHCVPRIFPLIEFNLTDFNSESSRRIHFIE